MIKGLTNERTRRAENCSFIVPRLLPQTNTLLLSFSHIHSLFFYLCLYFSMMYCQQLIGSFRCCYRLLQLHFSASLQAYLFDFALYTYGLICIYTYICIRHFMVVGLNRLSYLIFLFDPTCLFFPPRCYHYDTVFFATVILPLQSFKFWNKVELMKLIVGFWKP